MALQCIHLGEETGERRQCLSCHGNVREKVFQCKHGYGHVTMLMCQGCPDMKRKTGPLPEPRWGFPPDIQHQLDEYEARTRLMKPFVAEGLCKHDGTVHREMCLDCALADLDRPPRVMSKAACTAWAGYPAVIEAHRLGVERCMEQTCPQPSLSARGVVIAAGGTSYFTNAWINASVLSAFGTALPVEFWHLGRAEMDPQMQKTAAVLGIACRDARQLPQPRILSGWELKPFSILNSSFKEVLCLDADNVLACSPDYLFDEPEYREKGAIFWPDLPPPPPRIEWIPPWAWYSVGLDYKPQRAFESGQIVVNKEKCWKALNLTMWLCAHSDRYFEVVYGDKDTFLLAWERTGTPYAITPHAAGGCTVGIIQRDFAGKHLFTHRCQGKWRYRGRNQYLPGFPGDAEAHAGLDRLRRIWHGRIWSMSDQTPEETAISRHVAGMYTYERVGLGERPLELLPDGTIGLGRAECEESWSIRILDDEPTLIIVGKGKATMFLTQESGEWHGKWESFEECPVRLCSYHGASSTLDKQSKLP
jgi:hypothetical protein